jgi:hypothetical protein
MKATTQNLAINKKGTKVVISGKPKYYNVLATSLQFAPVLTYIALKFDMFTFQNQGYAITGWGITAVAVFFLAFRSKIKEKLKEYDDTLGETWKRSKSGTVSIVLGLVMFGVYVFATNFFAVFMIYGASTYASLLLYKPYDELSIKRKAFQKTLDEENQKKDFEQMQKQFLDLKTPTQTAKL